jgi:hypothetical protein
MWYKVAKIEKEMEDFFKERTNRHIALVGKYCKKIADYDKNRFGELIERAKVHDSSKFEEPEKDPYIYITWQYKCKDEGKEFDISEDMKEKMSLATEKHIKNKLNTHHPEASCDKEVALINRENRDLPPKQIVDATKMTDLDIGEMCADWFSMSEEKKSNPKDWADKNVNIRWKFTDKQKDLIYELIEEIWE